MGVQSIYKNINIFPFDDVIMSGVSWDLLQAVFMFLRITHSDYRNNTTEAVSDIMGKQII